MSVIVKPIMFFMFCCALCSFINVLLIFITVNQTTMVLNEAIYVVETYGSSSATYIQELEEKYSNKFDITLEYMEEQEFKDSTNVVVTTEYEYIARDRTIEIKQNEIVMNKQL